MLSKIDTILLSTFLLTVCFISSVAPQEVSDQPNAKAVQNTSPEKQALIKELLTTLDVKKNLDAVLEGMFDQMEKQMPDLVFQSVSERTEIKRLSPDQMERLREETKTAMANASKRMRELFTQKINLAQITEEISGELYDKYFNEGELKDLIAFHKSTTGRKFIEIMPMFLSESMNKTRERITPVVMEIVSEISKEQTERIQKQASSAPPQPKPSKSLKRKTQPRRRG